MVVRGLTNVRIYAQLLNFQYKIYNIILGILYPLVISHFTLQLHAKGDYNDDEKTQNHK